MKKILAVVLATLMLLSVSCKKNESSDFDYVKNKGKLVIGITLFAPINYMDKDGNLVGFDTDFAKEVCARLGVEPVFSEINWDLKETELVSKNIDCVWNGMTITEKLKENLSISNPYLSNRQILITKSADVEKYAKNTDGMTISVEQGSAGEEITTTLPFFANAKVTPVDSQAKALLEVKSGLSNGAVVDYVVSFGSIGEGTDYDDLSVVDCIIGESEMYGIAFRKNSDLTSKVNEIIEAMKKDGSLEQIAKKYNLDGLLID